MENLTLSFIDQSGREQSVEIETDFFTIGRHSASDLTIADSRLSREHVRFEKIGGRFFATDLGSSNGTALNGVRISGSTALKDGDLLDLGGAVAVKISIGNAEIEEDFAWDKPDIESAVEPETSAAASIPIQPKPTEPKGLNIGLFILAPLLGLLVVGLIFGVLYISRSKNSAAANSPSDDYVAELEDDNSTSTIESETNSRQGGNRTSDQTSNSVGNASFNGRVSDAPTTNSMNQFTNRQPDGGEYRTTNKPTQPFIENEKVERNAALFARRIAINDPKAFLTGEQAKRVDTKVKQIGKSSPLVANISSARKHGNAITKLAESKSLRPQFLAVAAITKLGNNRGDVLETAESVVEVYDKLRAQIGNQLYDDALLMVAAFDQGSAGETMKLRNTLEQLATEQKTEDTRVLRSIWFLEKSGKIAASDFDRALYFLAVGTITQNPKEFGYDIDPLIL